MVCQSTVSEDQSEFEFFQQLFSNKDNTNCCGPRVRMGFGGHSLSLLTSSLLAAGYGIDYLDNCDPLVLDSSHLSFIHCSRHWIGVVRDIGSIAVKSENDLWMQLSFYVFRVLCLTNSWDHKELMNYLKTLGMIDLSN